MIILLVVVAIFLTWWASRIKNILVSLSASLVWFSITMWLFFDTTPLMGIGAPYQNLLLYAFAMLVFVPMLIHIDTEIRYEKDGRNWTEHGEKPNYENTVDAYSDYKKELQRRVRRR